MTTAHVLGGVKQHVFPWILVNLGCIFQMFGEFSRRGLLGKFSYFVLTIIYAQAQKKKKKKKKQNKKKT